MYVLWILTAALTVALSSPVLAGPGRGKGDPNKMVERVFERLDQNKDDHIDRAEAEGSRLAQRFDQIDANEDGRVSRAELLDAFEKRRSKRQQ